MLPKNKRQAINTVYAFCRKTDDIVDDDSITKNTKQLHLNKWRSDLSKSLEGEFTQPLFKELVGCINEFNIPQKPFFDLIDGMEMDLNKNRYNTFEELKEYCYKVASTVGLMTIPIFGYKNKLTVDYAVDLGIALQLTNILRDIKSDSLRGRIYIPLEDLEKYEYTEEELFNGTHNKNFVNLMRSYAIRTKEFYNSADKNLSKDDKSSMFTARSMQYIYHRLLDKIEQEDYNVFKSKIRVSTFNKLFITLSVWLKYKLLYHG